MTDPRVVAVQLVVWASYPEAVVASGGGWFGVHAAVYSGARRPRRLLAVGRDEAHAWREAEAKVLAEVSAMRREAS